jgi:hypothetical protein
MFGPSLASIPLDDVTIASSILALLLLQDPYILGGI